MYQHATWRGILRRVAPADGHGCLRLATVSAILGVRMRARAAETCFVAALAWAAYAPHASAQADSGAHASVRAPATDRDGQHDFDFEFGSWRAHLRRLVRPLTGSNTWVEYDGTSVVRKIWDGRANLGELEVSNATTHVEGLSLRLYSPQSHQWSIYWSNSEDGTLTTPMIGQFTNGRGEFYDQELFQGRAIFVRFIFSDITPTSFHLEQAFSADGGRSWVANWVTTFTRVQS
jgi:hypothetical protein